MYHALERCHAEEVVIYYHLHHQSFYTWKIVIAKCTVAIREFLVLYCMYTG